MTAAATPRRRWFQFSLRTLLIFTLLLSIPLAGFAWRLQRARKQATAVAVVRNVGGHVQYDYDFEATPNGGFSWVPKKESKVPPILLEWLGEDFFHDVHAVNANRVQPKSPQDVQQFWQAVATFSAMHHFQLEGDWLDHDGFAALRGNRSLQHVLLSSKHVADTDLAVAGTMPNLREFHLIGFGMTVTDDGIAALDGLGELRSFNLYHAGISDDAARHLAKHPKLIAMQLSGNHLTDESTVWLARLTELRQLSLNGTAIGDKGLENLKALSKLTSLDMSNTRITDDGLVHVAQMTDLSFLGVQLTKVHGPGLIHLRKLSKLETIGCLGNPITDDDLQFFAGLPSLHTLPLGESGVTDEGIRRLKISPKVTELQLVSTKITDRSLETLATNSQLTFLWVSNTKVSAAGIARFKKRVPACNVVP